MKYFSVLEPWLEPKYKLIAQSPAQNYDPGDTAQREGMVAVGAFILHQAKLMSNEEYIFTMQRYDKVLGLLNDPNHPGLLRRYPDPAYWGGLSDRLSRDQSVPNVIGMGFMNMIRLRDFWNAHTKYSWRWLTTNTRRNWAWPPGHPEYNEKEYKWKLPDLTILSFTASYIRAFRRTFPTTLRLWLYDLDLLANSFIKVHSYAKDPTNSDDLNHLMNLYQAEILNPTYFSKLAFWYYQKRSYPNEPTATDNVTKLPVPVPTNPAQACMNHYFRNHDGGPKLEVYYEDINKYMVETFTWKLRPKFA